METAVAPAAVPAREMTPEDVARLLDLVRVSLGLEAKGEYPSNFVFDSPALECVHVLRIAFDDIYEELEAAEAEARGRGGAGSGAIRASRQPAIAAGDAA